jgi:tRNA A37 threonylcarbamoyladenosine dehydratase
VSQYENRFGGLERMFGDDYLQKAQRAHVCVVGIGGVGTWAVESLARSGIGKLTLLDLDDVCITNTNRQLHAFEGQVGKLKVQAMAERVLAINPEAEVVQLPEFFTAASAERILSSNYDYVVDAIDSVPDKCVMISECLKRNISLVVSGGAGGKSDPSRIAIADLAQSQSDNLLKSVKRELRTRYGIEASASGLLHVPCVFSREPAVMPWDVCSRSKKPEAGGGMRIDCASGFGAASFVTGAFGLALASHVVRDLASRPFP